MILEKINSIADLKRVPKCDLPKLCEEIRSALLTKLSEHGGHIGPNLGIVEVTVAMHYVFNSPVDKIVFDVSHQCYTHKILTGRKDAFLVPSCYDDVNGFTNPEESEHDLFTVGHTSTGISLACGLAKARDLLGQKHNVLTIVGDGSLSGGEAYEGLNNVAEQGTNFIAVVNDNEMSIAENHGGYYKNLELLRQTNGQAQNNLFRALGLDYVYAEDGNDVLAMVDVFEKLKDIDHPVVLHVHTQKGKGFWAAENNREVFHSGGPFSVEKGTYLFGKKSETYNEITYNFLKEKMQNDSSVVAISSATPTVLAMNADRRRQAGKQFVDVGICEEHAVAFASGIAKGGAKPVYAVFSSFIQRSFDQLHQDLALDNNPATILVFWASVNGMGGPTHNGLYDIAEISNIPNLLYLAPTCVEEYLQMLDWSIEQRQKSVVIRVPLFVTHGEAGEADYLQKRCHVVNQGKDVAIIAVGSTFETAKAVCHKLQQNGIAPTLINPVVVSSLDSEALENLKHDHKLIVTLEEGIVEGGYGQKVASYFGDSEIRVKNFGLEKSFFGDYQPQKLLEENGLVPDAVFNYVLENLDNEK